MNFLDQYLLALFGIDLDDVGDPPIVSLVRARRVYSRVLPVKARSYCLGNLEPGLRHAAAKQKALFAHVLRRQRLQVSAGEGAVACDAGIDHRAIEA